MGKRFLTVYACEQVAKELAWPGLMHCDICHSADFVWTTQHFSDGVTEGWYRCMICEKNYPSRVFSDRPCSGPLLSKAQAKRMRKQRQAQGYSIRDLSTWTKIPVSRLSDIERGLDGVRPDERHGIEHFLKFDLFGDMLADSE